MSALGLVMMRVVKLAPGVENSPVVVPAPKISELALLVVTVPLLAVPPVPDAEVPTGAAVRSRPLYSRARTSTKGVAVLKVVVTVLVPAGAALMFGASEIAWLAPLAR